MRPQYEHKTYISVLLRGKEPLTFPPELTETIRGMFAQLQQPWRETKPAHRNNFMSYKHCIHKMLELLGEDKYLKLFPLLKHPAKRYDQDQMWKAMCEKLRWQYISSS